MTIYIDSNVLIYTTQPQSEFFVVAMNVLKTRSGKNYQLATSSFGLAECLAKSADNVLAHEFEVLLLRHEIEEIPFGHDAALEFAKIRIENGKSLHPPDVIHLACARAGRADIFVTNDLTLCKTRVSGLKIVPLTEFTST